MIGTTNKVVTALKGGEVALGSLTLLQEPAVGEILGRCGYDFLIIDTEHAAADEQTVLAMVRAAQAASVTPLVRLRNADHKQILWALDTGAGGIVIPTVESGDAARALVEASFYPPRGKRTVCSATRAAGHGTARGDFSEYLDWAAENVVTIALVETVRGMEALDDILASGIDVVMLGRADLSLDMGLGYAPWHPDVMAASEKVVERALAAGVVPGVLAYSPEEARSWIAKGVRFVAYSQPEMILSDTYRSAIEAIRGDRG
ncbi:HpcH/HpaI aldolase/citrate lyase family protein [Homoserinibacter sp. GY 40078]|uniref:HpcH/HpaI aldolase family protein n=1 Tax=Homoserinibacter sp. GY 40078 TaxID=2603275 RepID=UPI0011CB94F6|nr:aldolase/citrate lyase family protein [Homoserinibacter sp. GY 40078]TXK18671.1 2-keto-3-deoxy-L-rhamnonate aldolase [Homoserinibacter sp. GY 40078]